MLTPKSLNHEKRIVPTNDEEEQHEANGDDNNNDAGGDNEEEMQDYEYMDDEEYYDDSAKAFYVRWYHSFKSTLTLHFLKKLMRWFIDTAHIDFSISFQDLLLAMTLYVLYMLDITYLTLPKSADSQVRVGIAICTFTFAFEFLANNWSKTEIVSWYPFRFEGYLFSFFWFIDLLSILSLFPDVPFIANPLGISNLSNNISGNSNYTQAGRVLRLVRLVRLVKIYKIVLEKRKQRQMEQELIDKVKDGSLMYDEYVSKTSLNIHRESRLGTMLSESTTQRVIIMILILVIVVPLLIYVPSNYGPQFSADMIQAFNIDPNVTADATRAIINVTISALYAQIGDNRYIDYVYVSPTLPSNPYINYESNIKSLRNSVQLSFVETYVDPSLPNVSYVTRILFNLNYLLWINSYFEIILTTFVGIMLVGGAVVFTNDADRLVIAPIERMMNMVDAVAANPLAKFNNGDRELTGEAGEYETRLLESTIEKITGLLRVGFGEAGAGIISANLSAQGSAALNPLLPGVRVYAIFGFCDIHHFEDINRLLTQDVLTFVNSIAGIVHENVRTWGGQCNKNLGNAFVIVWRIGDENKLINDTANIRINKKQRNAAEDNGINRTNSRISVASKLSSNESQISLDDEDEESKENVKKRSQLVDLRRVPGVDVLADQALIGYLKIIVEINRNKKVLSYRNEPRLTHDNTEEFKVRMGFGLHAGWAIEGAVGSLQKVDATYLSPHVNMAARLETSSRQYGVPLLASQDFYDLLSNEVQRYCRRLDVVTVKGSEVPIGIYTYDALQEQDFENDGKALNGMVSMSSKSGANSTQASPSEKNRKRRYSAETKEQQATLKASGGLGIKLPPLITTNGIDSNTSTQAADSPLTTPGPLKRRFSATLIPGQDKQIVFMTPEDNTADTFEQDYDLIQLRKHLSPEFLDAFKEGVSLYLSGDWTNAKLYLEKSNAIMKTLAPILEGDGPSQTLLSYMQARNYEAPSTWKGYRPLTSK